MSRAWRYAFCLAFLACRSGGEKRAAKPRPVAIQAGSVAQTTTAATATATATATAPNDPSSAFVLAFTQFSETGAKFRGDNLVSNEGSYLDVASALRRIAEDLSVRSLVLRTFYVSNVEQYLFKAKLWPTWVENLRAFPIDSETRLLRSYMSSARPHPAQREGARTASFMTRLRIWLNCEERKPSKDYFTAISRPECGNPRPQADDSAAASRVSRR